MADKVAVYTGTRNVYPQMYTSLKSLLLNTEMDRVYLIIEDDKFPYPVPSNVLLINASEQTFFKPGSPNYSTSYSYMELLRCALSFILKEDLVLWLDIDTIIDNDISDLFSLDMTGYYYAGAIEPQKCRGIFMYVNVGVLLCNLALLRDTHKELELIGFLNQYHFDFPGQDVINLLCQGGIRVIGSEYNTNDWGVPCTRPKVIHYAAVKPDIYKKDWAYQKYERIELPLEEVSNDG